MDSSSLLPAIIAAIVAAVIAARHRNRLRKLREAQSQKTNPPPPAPVSPPAPTPPPSPANTDDEPVAAVLLRVGAKLEKIADRSSHPNEMKDWPEFKDVVAVFCRPDVTIDQLCQYALGDNWPLACAAFVALSLHEERDDALRRVFDTFAKLRPWTIAFALDYICSLNNRPATGVPALAAQNWWAENLVIPGLFRDYFDRRAEMGDDATFYNAIDDWRFHPDFVQALLQRVDNASARSLLNELRDWRAGRTNTAFLSSFGRLWAQPDEDKTLVEPAAWGETLKAAGNVVLQHPPRSLAVSGESRVGKTSFIRLLAMRLAKSGWRIFEASGAELQSGQIYIGQLEERIRQLVVELDAGKKIAWYVGDLLQLAESGTHRGQSASILDQIMPAVAAGRLVILSESSASAASRLFQFRPSLRSLIEVCRINPMSEATSAALAGQVGERMRAQMGLSIAPETVTAASQLAQQYFGLGQLPGILIDLLRRAATRAQAANSKELTTAIVIDTLAQITGLPRGMLDDKERIDLSAIRTYLAGRVMGQSEAVNAVVDRIAMLKAGLIDPRRPIAVFLFAGPTGTGKTELAKTLAQFLFGSSERMARLDMSELQSSDATSKILGLRGQTMADSLVERIRKQPFSVILLDEFEKAHPNVWDLFLQIFDDGRLSDANGQVVDFRHCFIILTSNLGATSHRSAGMGFAPEAASYSEGQVLRAVGQTFRPEFINRLDKIIVFQPLSRELMRDILKLELKRLQERRGLRQRDWAVEWESSAIEFLLDKGFSPEMGARPLRRAIDQYVLAPLAASLVEHRLPEGDQFMFVRSNGKAIEVEFVDPDAEPLDQLALASDAEVQEPTSLAAMILRPHGTPAELASLKAKAAAIENNVAGDDWRSLRDRLAAEAGDPGIWSRGDRLAVFARRAQIDRVEEAARTAERLRLRLESSARRPGSASRELSGRLALQLYLVQQGIDDALTDAPVDALISVEPVLDSGADAVAQAAWCMRLLAMYRHWAQRRHMQLDEYLPVRQGGAPILQITGFGAFRRLAGEAGLHVLEAIEGGPRLSARVVIVSGPLEDPRPGEAYRSLASLLAKAEDSATVIRRYREKPAPLVRDSKAGWRSGRLDAVLGGDFDLIGEAQR